MAQPPDQRGEDDEAYSRHDKPWTEAQWDRFLRRTDARADRYGELMETLRSDPDRDAKLDREMGWNRSADVRETRSPDSNGGLLGATPFDDELQEQESAEWRAQRQSQAAELQSFRAYALSMRLTVEIEQLLRGHAPEAALRSANGRRAEDDDPRWRELYMAASMPAAKIAAAQGIGFERQNLCGAIVNVRRGLAAVRSGLLACAELLNEGKLPPAVGAKVQTDLRDLEAACVELIGELRSKVYWDPEAPAV